MAKRLDWIDNNGVVIFRATDSFTRSARKALDEAFPRQQQHHMRMGHYAVIIVGGTLIAARLYDTDGSENTCPRDSEFFDSSRRDRLSQIARVEPFLRPAHPMFDGITACIAAERARLG